MTSLRAVLKKKANEAKEKAEIYYLVYWDSEETVSIHSDEEVKAEGKCVGAFCEVRFGKQEYRGKIACIGSKAYMILREKDYLKGVYTPFQSEPTAPTSPQGTNTATEATKDFSVKKTKKKRKLIGTIANDKERSVEKPNEGTRNTDKRKLAERDSNGENKSKKRKGSPTTKKKRGNIISLGCGASISACESDVSEEQHQTKGEETQQTTREKTQQTTGEETQQTMGEETQQTMGEETQQTIGEETQQTTGEETQQTMGEETQQTTEEETQQTRKDTEQHVQWQSYLDNYENYYAMETDYHYKNSLWDFEDSQKPPLYTELKNRIQQLELSVAQLLDYPSTAPLRMRHVITTPSRFHPYPLRHSSPLQCSQSPLTSPFYSQRSSPDTSLTEHQLQQPLVDLTNSPNTSGDQLLMTSSSNKSMLDTLAAEKEADPLPQINEAELLKPEDVVENYSRFLTLSKIPRLAVRLSKESFFGNSIMARCTVRGAGKYHALPKKQLQDLKSFLTKLCIPRHTPSQIEFEMLWKDCSEAIGQACKSLRRV